MTQLPMSPDRPARAHWLDATAGEGPAALLLCDEHAKVLRMNEAARQTLAWGEVLLLRADASLAVLSHGTGLLALRSAVRAAARDGAAHALTLRHGPAQLRVSVAPLPGRVGPGPFALLSLGQGLGATPQALADLLTDLLTDLPTDLPTDGRDKPLTQTAAF